MGNAESGEDGAGTAPMAQQEPGRAESPVSPPTTGQGEVKQEYETEMTSVAVKNAQREDMLGDSSGGAETKMPADSNTSSAVEDVMAMKIDDTLTQPARKPPKNSSIAGLSYADSGLFGAMQPFLLFLSVWLVATFVFHKIEHPVEKDILDEYWEERNDLQTDLDASNKSTVVFNTTVSTSQLLDDYLDWLADNLGCEPDTDVDPEWSWVGSIFYAYTLATCIGYGSFAPRTTSGRAVTFAFSFISIPIFMACISTISDWFLSLVDKLEIIPEEKARSSADNYLRKIGVTCAIFTAMLAFWVIVVGGFALPALMDDGRTFIDSVYFAWISLTTIGLGDFVFDIEKCKGLTVLFIIIGLSIFGLALSFAHRVLSLVIDKQRFRQKHVEIDEMYTASERALVVRAFKTVDKDGSGDIDGKELQGLLQVLGLHVSDSGVLDTLYKHDTTGSNTLTACEWKVFMAPFVTEKGKRRKFYATLKFTLVSWVAIALWCCFGGYIMKHLEKPGEKDDIDTWKFFVSAVSSTLNTTELDIFSEILHTMSSGGLCSFPSCSSYSYDQSTDHITETTASVFQCESYDVNWTLAGAIFYCFTLITTIGYGSFTPSTNHGKLFSVYYSVIGILLFGNGIAMISQLPNAIRGYVGDKFLRQLCGVGSYADEDKKLRERKAAELLRQAERAAWIARNKALPPEEREIILDVHGMPIVFDSKAYQFLHFCEGPTVVLFMIFLVCLDGIFLAMYGLNGSPPVVHKIGYAMSAVFAVDFFARLGLYKYVYGNFGGFFSKHAMRKLDGGLVAVDLAAYLLTIYVGDSAGVTAEVKLLRALRALRLLRYCRLAKLWTNSAFATHLVKHRAQLLAVLASFSLVCCYMFVSGFFVGRKENWGFWNSVYFIWISVTTIGLGDFVPQPSNYIMAMFWICLGLALLTDWLAEVQDLFHSFYHGSLSFEESEARLEKEAGENETDLIDVQLDPMLLQAQLDEAEKQRQEMDADGSFANLLHDAVPSHKAPWMFGVGGFRAIMKREEREANRILSQFHVRRRQDKAQAQAAADTEAREEEELALEPCDSFESDV